MTEQSEPAEPDWSTARIVWSAAGIDLPEAMEQSDQNYLSRLNRVAAIFHNAKTVTEDDRSRHRSLSDIAEQCRDLFETLIEIDDTALVRIAGVSSVPVDQLLQDAVSSLSLLEQAMLNANQPTVPRKKPNEHNDFLVVLLAKEYEQVADKPASVTTNPITNEREGPFVSFVFAFVEHFLPGHSPIPTGRAIQRALKVRRDNPDPMQE